MTLRGGYCLLYTSGMRLHKLNGTSAGTGDIKAVMAEIGTFQSRNGLLLYLDASWFPAAIEWEQTLPPPFRDDPARRGSR